MRIPEEENENELAPQGCCESCVCGECRSFKKNKGICLISRRKVSATCECDRPSDYTSLSLAWLYDEVHIPTGKELKNIMKKIAGGK